MTMTGRTNRQMTPRQFGLLLFVVMATFRLTPAFSGENDRVGSDRGFLSVHRVFDVQLGIHDPIDVVCLLGPADAASSSVCDLPDPGADNRFVLLFHSQMLIEFKREILIFVSFNTASWEAEELVVDFASAEGGSQPVPWQSFVSVFGAPSRLVHQSLKLDEGGVEGSLSDCDDPSGQFVSAVYDSPGVQAFLSGEPGPTTVVSSLRIHNRSGDRAPMLPDCIGSQ